MESLTEGWDNKGASAAKSGEQALRSDELKNALDRAIQKLPEKPRTAFILFCVENLSQKEVANIMDCTIELVKWNVFQARKKLKEMLQDYLD